MSGFIKFMKGALRLKLWIQLWLVVLVLMNLIGPLLFLAQFEAQVVLVIFLISATLMMLLTGWVGFTRLLGLGHILWLPLLLFLWARLDQISAGDPYGLWLRSLMVINGIALLFDITDVIHYLTGDRAELVEGL